ncbi:MAG: flagellar hook-basal body complex protein [Eubacteriales bacterium]
MTAAMYSAISGLQSHMSKLAVIGNNVANVNTHSYKSYRMTFNESIYSTTRAGSNSAGVVTGGLNPSQVGYGTNVSSIDIKMSTSTYSPTGFNMDCMISGDGFFLTGTKDLTVNGGEDLTQFDLSRMGDFRIDDDGYIVDSRRAVIFGFAMVQNPEYNVDATPEDLISNPEWGEEFILSTDLVPLRAPIAAAVPTEDNGGIIDGIEQWGTGDAVYDVLTVADPSTDGGPTYNVTPSIGDLEYEFGVAGAPATDAVNTSIVPNDQGTTITLTSLSIDATGKISGINDASGLPVTIGYVAIANCQNSSGVTNIGSCYYKALGGAGDVSVSIAGGLGLGLYLNNRLPAEDGSGVSVEDALGKGDVSIMNGGLEASNADLATEFAEMIITQRGYQANTRMVTVTDSMLEELVNMKR